MIDLITACEIIGSEATIVDSTCPTLKNIRGTIVLETRNMIFLDTTSGLKGVSKVIAESIKLENEHGACFISGSSITGRPEDRISRIN